MRYIQDDHVYNTKIYYKQLYTPIIRVAYILYTNTKCVFAENTNRNGIVFSPPPVKKLSKKCASKTLNLLTANHKKTMTKKNLLFLLHANSYILKKKTVSFQFYAFFYFF